MHAYCMILQWAKIQFKFTLRRTRYSQPSSRSSADLPAELNVWPVYSDTMAPPSESVNNLLSLVAAMDASKTASELTACISQPHTHSEDIVICRNKIWLSTEQKASMHAEAGIAGHVVLPCTWSCRKPCRHRRSTSSPRRPPCVDPARSSGSACASRLFPRSSSWSSRRNAPPRRAAPWRPEDRMVLPLVCLGRCCCSSAWPSFGFCHLSSASAFRLSRIGLWCRRWPASVGWGCPEDPGHPKMS